MKRFLLCLLCLLALVAIGAWSTLSLAGPAAPQKSSWGQIKALYRAPMDTEASTAALPSADKSQPSQITRPGVNPMAVPPSFPGWSVVNAYDIGEIYDRNEGDIDWLVKFRIPGRTTKPRYYIVAAKNIWGVWNNWSANNYAQFYTSFPVGSSYEMQFTVGKGKAWLLNVRMDPGNWALYYHD